MTAPPANPSSSRLLAGPLLQQRLLHAFDSLASRFGRKPPPIAPHLATGLRGEEEAFFYLKRQGHVVIARRWRTPKHPGDIDLIAWQGETLCFIEVKTRTGRDIVPAEFAVDQHKQKTLRTLAAIFRKRLPQVPGQRTLIRFDVVAVYLPAASAPSGASVEIELFPSAFRF